jgi:hypothetical protein
MAGLPHLQIFEYEDEIDIITTVQLQTRWLKVCECCQPLGWWISDIEEGYNDRNSNFYEYALGMM